MEAAPFNTFWSAVPHCIHGAERYTSPGGPLWHCLWAELGKYFPVTRQVRQCLLICEGGRPGLIVPIF